MGNHFTSNWRTVLRRAMRTLSYLAVIFVLVTLAALAGGCSGPATSTPGGVAGAVARPAQLDTSPVQTTQGGLYRIEFVADQEPIPVSKLHTWTLHITAADGVAVEGAAVRVEGGMPEHNHGMPTQPQVTALGAGDYRVEGMKFQMPGWWTVTVTVEANGQPDQAVFNLLLD